MARKRSKRIQCDPIVGVIEDITHEGAGVVKPDGKAVFVPDTLPGEEVEFQPVRRFRSYDEAELLKVITASPDRVEPSCEHFGRCGGCNLMHMAPEAQIRYKQNMLVENLKRLGHVESEEIVAPLTGPSWGYRRKARLGVKHVHKKGKVLVGFRERGAPYIAELKACKILAAPVGEMLTPLAEMIATLSIIEKLPQIEVAIADNDVALVLRVLEPPSDSDLDTLRVFAEEHKVSFYLQPKGPSTIYPLDENAQSLYYELPEFDARLEFLPSDFTQINPDINAKMMAQAVEWLDLQEGDTVLELFAGLGNFTVPLARKAGKVVTVEGEAGLVERGRQNALRNGCENVECHVANLYEDISAEPWQGQKYDKVLLDPPRSGAAEMMPLVAATGAKTVVYVSCHPGTLARDAGLLVNDHGYRLVKAGAMDMFPHTAHVESMALFIKD